MTESEQRKLSVFVFGVEESASTLIVKRSQDDTKVFVDNNHSEVKTNISNRDIFYSW